MNNGPLLFLGILATLASSFWGLLLAAQLQIGRQQPIVLPATGETYPVPRAGLAQQGAEIFLAQGCAECHTRQVRQAGVHFDVWLIDAGTNPPALAAILAQRKLGPGDAAATVAQVPVRLATGLTLSAAQGLAGHLTNDGAKAEAWLVALGPDMERNWGRRLTVAQDYLHDYPVQLGNLRLGPDLANVGVRSPDARALLQKLYHPQSVERRSMMPPYRYLFEKRRLSIGDPVPPDAVAMINRTDNHPGEAVVPRPEAQALVAYLQSLRSETELPNAPITKVAGARSTNAPAASVK